MTLDANNFVVRLLIAVLVYFLFNIVIDTFIKDASSNQMFKIILLFACLIIALTGFFLRLP